MLKYWEFKSGKMVTRIEKAITIKNTERNNLFIEAIIVR